MITESTRINLSIGLSCTVAIWLILSAYQLGVKHADILKDIEAIEKQFESHVIDAKKEYGATHMHMGKTTERLASLETKVEGIAEQNSMIMKHITRLASKDQPTMKEEKKPPWIVVDEAIGMY